MRVRLRFSAVLTASVLNRTCTPPTSSALQTTDKCGHLALEAFSRKEVIQPHLPIRLPCYDFTPVMNLTVVGALLAVRLTYFW